MIGILSKSELEQSTDEVINWIHSRNRKWVRFNGDDRETMVKLFNECLNSKGKLTNVFSQINVVWARRWNNNGQLNLASSGECFGCNNKTELNRHLKAEQGRLSFFLFEQLKEKKWLSDPKKLNLNKLIVLNLAQKVGLNIPKSIICTEKKELTKFLDEHQEIISKCISDSPRYTIGTSFHSLKTIPVDSEFIENLPETFFPSFFQKEIKKEFEIRVFFLDGDFYSMAIFSQRNSKTRLDFRNYDTESPNRFVPYKLPKNQCDKIEKLMAELELKTGSIDLVKSTDGEYYFLEINPVGQFGMVSIPCNYYLEKKIADYLIREDENF